MRGILILFFFFFFIPFLQEGTEEYFGLLDHIRNLDFVSYIGLQGSISCGLVISFLLFCLYFHQVGYEDGKVISSRPNSKFPTQVSNIPG